jgi:hypothetical protein
MRIKDIIAESSNKLDIQKNTNLLRNPHIAQQLVRNANTISAAIDEVFTADKLPPNKRNQAIMRVISKNSRGMMGGAEPEQYLKLVDVARAEFGMNPAEPNREILLKTLEKIKNTFDIDGTQKSIGEASSAAQQAAIAINMKKRGKKPKHDESVMEADKTDTVSLDIPLLLRMMEYAREDAKTDLDLHDVAEKMIALSKNHDYLCMDNYNEIVGSAAHDDMNESCPHCGGLILPESRVDEKQDACYYKVKSRYKVWPSAYASGALVTCRKKGAANWGNKSK